MVPPYSDRIPRVPPYLSQAQYHNRVFAYGAVTLYGTAFTEASANPCNTFLSPQPPRSASASRVWPLPISLAATLGISFDFFSSPYLDVSVQAVSPRIPIYSVYVDCVLPQPGFPIRTSRDQGLFAPPPGFSQLVTSFIGS